MTLPYAPKPTHQVPCGGPILCFRDMVAPTSKNACCRDTCPFGTPLPGDVPKLPREIHACTQVAPSLHSALWAALQIKQIPVEDINTSLTAKNPSQGMIQPSNHLGHRQWEGHRHLQWIIAPRAQPDSLFELFFRNLGKKCLLQLVAFPRFVPTQIFHLVASSKT